MVEAFLWGAVSASALLAGAIVAYQLRPGRRLIASAMAFGTGLLLGSVSFELIDEALNTRTVAAVSLLVLIGAGVFAVGDWLLSRRGAGDGAQAAGSPLAIVLGSVLDGIPSRSCSASPSCRVSSASRCWPGSCFPTSRKVWRLPAVSALRNGGNVGFC
ncbi:hypothetical protein [Paractinoplanes toevensis]|uniref:Uncharacterized protein n=1 Tax=Paractinoplanes toevensis TaxID=571911 RepID=A0A919T5J5_9ACTN|nr:hypothetical protein [Actinoplanes toevensis]GIM89588.1 hypothetical protein Ato02nite_013810 [Actinoplanes toevensis]